MINILITSGTHALALRAKKKIASHFNVILGVSGDIPTVVKNQFIQLPQYSSSTFIHEILKIALNNNIKYILPLNGKEISLLSEVVPLFDEYDVKIIAPSKDDLLDIKTMINPDKSFDLTLLIDGMNIIEEKPTDMSISGFGILSDSEKELIIAIVN